MVLKKTLYIYNNNDGEVAYSGKENPNTTSHNNNKTIGDSMKVNSPHQPGVTEKYDDIVAISELQFDDDNIKLYGKDNPDYFKTLQNDIKVRGLKNPVVVYPNKIVKSGHTRIRACSEDFTHIPVIWSVTSKPTDAFENMMSLMMENQGRPLSISRQYNQITTSIEEWEKQNNNQTCADSIIKDLICPASQMSWNMFQQMRTLEAERHDLFKRVMDSDGEALSPGKAYQFMKDDKVNTQTINSSSSMNTAVNKQDVIYAVNAVSNAMCKLGEVCVNSKDGKAIPAFQNIQQNTLGGLVHEVFTNSIAHSINYRNSDSEYSIAFPPKSHNDEDIQFPLHNGGIEVKTCVIKDGNKVRFVCKKPKTGYFMFAAFSPDYNDAYVSYGYCDADIWKKAGRGVANIDLNKLRKSNITNFYGKLKLDKLNKKKKSVHCYSEQIKLDIN